MYSVSLRLLCVVCFFATVFSGYRFTTMINRMNEMAEVQQASRDLIIALLNAETGQRGYLITGNPDYTAPYSAGMSAIGHGLDELHRVIAPTVQSREEADVRSLTEQKMSELASTLALRRERGLDAVVEVVNRHLGKNLMDAIRVHVNNIDLWATGRYFDLESDATMYARIGFGTMLLTFLFGALSLRSPTK